MIDPKKVYLKTEKTETLNVNKVENLHIDEVEHLKWEDISIYDVIRTAIETCWIDTYNKTIKKQIDEYLDSRASEHVELMTHMKLTKKWLLFLRIGDHNIPFTVVFILSGLIGLLLFLLSHIGG
jgi:hypothetical protein